MADEGLRQKRYKLKEIVAKLRQVDVLISQSRPEAEAVRSTGVRHEPPLVRCLWS